MLGGGRVKVMRQRGAWNFPPPPWAKIELCNETLFGCKRARDLVENLHFAEYLWDTAALKKIKTFFSAVLNFPLYFLTPFIYISYGSFPLFSYPIMYEESRVEAFYYVYVTGIGVIGSPCASRVILCSPSLWLPTTCSTLLRRCVHLACARAPSAELS